MVAVLAVRIDVGTEDCYIARVSPPTRMLSQVGKLNVMIIGLGWLSGCQLYQQTARGDFLVIITEGIPFVTTLQLDIFRKGEGKHVDLDRAPREQVGQFTGEQMGVCCPDTVFVQPWCA
ncbi:MAG: hypothetical protein LBH87_01875 [Coriobacteriales bacterium]|jgi:hypothetical protein|nr:hypothetical protein [Coriobacteriales bacterium]